MQNAAVYIRVSTTDQTEYSPEAQLKALKDYANRTGLVIAEEHVYLDEGISGKSDRRPAFQRMIAKAKERPKPFDVILLWKFSRFARNREDAILYKSMLRRQQGVEVVSITEALGDDKMSLLVEALIEAMDEYYSINLAEEVRRGMAEKASRGEFQASPPLGYRKKPGEPLEIVEDEAETVRLIFSCFLAGGSMTAIASKLNDLGLSTKRGVRFTARAVEYILENPIYNGYIRWTPNRKLKGGKGQDGILPIIRPSGHVPILSEDQFKQAEDLLLLRRLRYRTHEPPAEVRKHYLSGILRCGACGSTLTYSQANGGFQCGGYGKGLCPVSHYLSAKKAENAILDECDRLFPVGGLQWVPDNSSSSSKPIAENNLKESETLRRQIKSLETRLIRVKDAYRSGCDTLAEYAEEKDRICKALSLIHDRLSKAEGQIWSDLAGCTATWPNCVSVREFLEGKAPIHVKSRSLRTILPYAIYHKSTETLEFHFSLE